MEIYEYIDANGNCPFNDWLVDLHDRNARARIDVRLNRVRLNNLGDHKSVGEGVYELRIPYGKGYRVYYGAVDQDTLILLLCGGTKATQAQDIKNARRHWRTFKEAQPNDNETGKIIPRDIARPIE